MVQAGLPLSLRFAERARDILVLVDGAVTQIRIRALQVVMVEKVVEIYAELETSLFALEPRDAGVFGQRLNIPSLTVLFPRLRAESFGIVFDGAILSLARAYILCAEAPIVVRCKDDQVCYA